MTPSEDMKLAQQGDALAYERFLIWVAEYVEMVVRNKLFRWAGPTDYADDLVQDVLVAIHEKKHTYSPAYAVEPWVAAIIRYKMIDWLRAKTRNRSTSVPNIDDLSGPSDQNDEATNRIDVEAAMQMLTPRQRELFELVKIAGLSIHEVSTKTGLSASAIKVSIHRTRKTLQKFLRGSRE